MAVPVAETALPASSPPAPSVAEISVLLPGGVEVRLGGSVDLALARAVIRAAGGAG